MTEVTVATLNLHQNADRWPARRRLLVAQVVDALPDLLSLQEIHLPSRQGEWLCKQINYRLSGSEEQPYRLVQKREQGLPRGIFTAVGVLSKVPILYAEGTALGHGGRVALRVHVELPSHQTMDFVTTHLHTVPYDKEARAEQAMKLVGWLHSHKHVPRQVVAGDFSDDPESLAVRTIKRSFRSAYAEVYGREPLATFPTALTIDDRPALCLDYIFVSSAVHQVTAAHLFCSRPDAEDDTLYPSNHVGLMATLRV